jgi:hypothetical protein
MKTLELNKMGLTPMPGDELKSFNGGHSLAYDVGSGLRWLFKFASNGGGIFGMQMAGLDRRVHHYLNSKK